MTRILTSLTAGFLIAFAPFTAASANTAPAGNAGAKPVYNAALLAGRFNVSPIGETAPPSVQPMQIAYSKIIRIGPRGTGFEKWRCAVTIYGDRYYSIGITETGARAWLQPLTPQYIHCRRDYRRK